MPHLLVHLLLDFLCHKGEQILGADLLRLWALRCFSFPLPPDLKVIGVVLRTLRRTLALSADMGHMNYKTSGDFSDVQVPVQTQEKHYMKRNITCIVGAVVKAIEQQVSFSERTGMLLPYGSTYCQPRLQTQISCLCESR